MKYIFFYDFIIGNTAIVEEKNKITDIFLADSKVSDNTKHMETSLIKRCSIQLNEYFSGKRKEFDIPVNPKGTEFQKKVWQEILKIPYGEVRTYKDIAQAVNNPKAYRAVGMANNKNPIMIIIPCHRVIGSNKKLIGYAYGIELKQMLLEHEKKSCDSIYQKLLELSEEEYRVFSSKLLPNNNNILGVRLPKLRKLAKEIIKSDWREYLNNAKDTYFEEVMLQGMVIGYLEKDITEIIDYLRLFLPKIDNWSVCDSFCSGLKITNKYKQIMWNFIIEYLSSKKPFEIRFSIVMMIFYYIDDEYIDKIFSLLDEIKTDEYYVEMAVAWAVSICYVKYPEKGMLYLINNSLNDFTYNKALQKIIESLVPCREEKEKIRKMKRIPS